VKVILFGATGMVGRGALRECLQDPDVESVLSIGRAETGQKDPKLVEMVRKDLADLSDVEKDLTGYDACFFCLGVSSSGMSEADYRRITCDLTLAVATTLVRLNPGMTFLYVSGAGTDANGGSMWARVKGETENALLKLPFKAAYMLRPGFIQPLHGIVSRTTLYRVLYAIMTPISPLLLALFPGTMTTTERLGRAMITAVRQGAPKPVLEARDIAALAPPP
jgi:uncharacterized protein YbjT (DUF2867 family)